MSPDASQPWTVLRLLDWTKIYFERAGLEDGRLSAEVLLAGVLGCERIELYTRFDSVPDEVRLAKYRELVKRASQHQPVAYLVGYKEFYSLRFGVTPEVLIPRCETEILVTEALTHLRGMDGGGLMWDVCTGSGCVAVAVAKEQPDARVLATDVSAAVVAVAAENAAAHDVADRVTCREADLLAFDEKWRFPRRFDVITANPPYVADGDPVGPSVHHEPTLALRAGADGLDLIRPLIVAAGEFINPGGALIIEFGYTHADAVGDILAQSGAFFEPRIIRDHQGIQRAAVAIRK